jgi:inhibitor of growth protein 3
VIEEADADPNEPTYCICNRVSFGEMIACDNDDCAREWFHYTCVGLTGPVKGKWFCPECTILMQQS